MADARSLTEHLKPHERIILAYDIGRFNEFEKMQLEKLLPYVGMVKIGYQAIFTRSLFTTMALEVSHCVGPSSHGYFLDTKLKDIENTVVGAIEAILSWRFPAKIITIHATMRYETILAALNAVKGTSTLIAGVTLLTDHSEGDARDIYGVSAEEVVINCADKLLMASQQAQLPVAMVCAPPDLIALQDGGSYDSIIKIAAGIRDEDAPLDDQQRTMSAKAAIEAGADYLVMGRPIMNATDSVAAAKMYGAQIAQALHVGQVLDKTV